MQCATIHALPSCGTERIFELRRAAQVAGARFFRIKPKASTKPVTSHNPWGGDAA
ncbi:hypothetical protein SA496_01135 [Pseudomonas sp. JS3066]|uniref:hypothetical protein n=1 Tax=Pseudomonas sp. JS3066 TaxID=3090665 RepID=UPI002E7AEC93|nr:hypothetical protein [Pseudomonas sp. JS3066]WVK93820.1 hypothetical protein SA496_01135 [Pseudomonas sp. JS3066]